MYSSGKSLSLFTKVGNLLKEGAKRNPLSGWQPGVSKPIMLSFLFGDLQSDVVLLAELAKSIRRSAIHDQGINL